MRLLLEQLEGRDLLSASPAYVPGELLVSFRPGVSQAEIGHFYAEYGFSERDALDRYARGDTSRLKLISVPAKRTVEIIASLEADRRVEYAEPNYLYTGAAQSATPTDPYYAMQYALNNVGQFSSTPDADIDATDAWEITTGSPDVLVAVIDNGVNYNHPDLVANIWANPFETPGDGIDNDGNGYVDDIHGIDTITDSGDPLANPAGDKGFHGTSVAGLIGARPFNEGTVGIAWRVGIVSVKLLDNKDGFKASDMVQAFQYINYLKNVQGQNIIATNNSYVASHLPRSVRDAMAGLDQPGMSPILHVCAAGNGGEDLDGGRQVFPAAFDLDNIISVAATGWHDEMADFSNYFTEGSTNYGATSVDLAAPGGFTITSHVTDPSGWDGFGGTSAAAPHVTGAAALVASAFPGITAAGIKARILGGVDPIGHVGDNSMKPTLTNGRLNIANALAGAAPEEDDEPPAAIGSLSASPANFQSITLTWTATGDDGTAGRAGFYDIRYSITPITAASWDTAIRAPGEPGPGRSGATESFTVTGLDPGTTYYFAIKARDNMGTESALSNVAPATTNPAAILYSDNIENGANGWAAEGLWHQSARRAYSPTRSWYYGDETTGTYDTGAANAGTLTSPVIDLGNATQPVLIYREWRSVQDLPIADFASLQVSAKTKKWATVSLSSFSTAIDPLNWQGFMTAFAGWNTPVDTEFDTPQWVSRAVDLSAYAGQAIRIRFTFDSGDPSFNSYEGWYVDDVNVFDATSTLGAASRGRGVEAPMLGATGVGPAALGGSTLGLATGDTIRLDVVDRTPSSDSEFTGPGSQGRQRRLDPLTVLAHEVSHLFGSQSGQDSTMQQTRSSGERLTPPDIAVNRSWWSAGLMGLTKRRGPFTWWL